MSKNNSKKQTKEQKEQKRRQQEYKLEKQRQEKQQRYQQLAERSSPLINMGLVDAYEFVLTQLAKTGIPQNNVYEFAAQSILKFEKDKRKKVQQINHIQMFNEEAIKEVKKKSPQKIAKPKKLPSTLPFKGQIKPSQLAILDKSREAWKEQP